MSEQPPAVREIRYSADEAGRGMWVQMQRADGSITSIFVPARHLHNLARVLSRYAKLLADGQREGEDRDA